MINFVYRENNESLPMCSITCEILRRCFIRKLKVALSLHILYFSSAIYNMIYNNIINTRKAVESAQYCKVWIFRALHLQYTTKFPRDILTYGVDNGSLHFAGGGRQVPSCLDVNKHPLGSTIKYRILRQTIV